MAHNKLIYGVVDDFFEKDVDPIIGGGAITQFPNIHARTQANVLFPIE